MLCTQAPADARVWYLAGPMTGIPQFNYPQFHGVATYLRDVHDMQIVSPAEQDTDAKLEQILASPDGDLSKISEHVGTWGDFLSHDVKLIADSPINGILFMQGWEKSRGARLEAFIGILCSYDFARYVPGNGIEMMTAQSVLAQLSRNTLEDIRDATL